MIRTAIKTIMQRCTRDNGILQEMRIRKYMESGRRPWSEGYMEYRQQQIANVVNDEHMLRLFRSGAPLPKEYGLYLDERMVEYPWLFSRMENSSSELLDAGSILNFDIIVSHPTLQNKKITILTLEPEPYCFFQRSISYHYGDIREMPFRDEWFDELVSLSTIEHVGMNNSIYSDDQKYVENKGTDYIGAVKELKRVTKRGGKIYISVPFGKHIHYGYYQQFDSEMIDILIDALNPVEVRETYYAYNNNQWDVSSRSQCEQYEAFNIHDTKYFNKESDKDYADDNAACSRAIAALECWV